MVCLLNSRQRAFVEGSREKTSFGLAWIFLQFSIGPLLTSKLDFFLFIQRRSRERREREHGIKEMVWPKFTLMKSFVCGP